MQHTENFSKVLFLKGYTNYNTMGMPLERKLDLVIKAISIFSAHFFIFLAIFPTSLINDAASPWAFASYQWNSCNEISFHHFPCLFSSEAMDVSYYMVIYLTDPHQQLKHKSNGNNNKHNHIDVTNKNGWCMKTAQFSGQLDHINGYIFVLLFPC